MFQPRSTEFDPRVSAIVDHLRAIQSELNDIGKRAGRRGAAGAAAAGNQIADTIGPILGDIADRFRRSQRAAVDEAVTLGSEAVRIGSRVGNDALGRVASQARQRPLLVLVVAIGVGVLIGAASRRA